jgi:serine/threonine protein kinase
MSPEAIQLKSPGKEADLWSFGCNIFEMLVGKPPFKSDSQEETFEKIKMGDYKFPNVFNLLINNNAGISRNCEGYHKKLASVE